MEPDPDAVEVAPGTWLHWNLYLRGSRDAGRVRYRAMARVAEGHQQVGGRWERRYVEVTLSSHDDYDEALRAVDAFVEESGPRIQWAEAWVR